MLCRPHCPTLQKIKRIKLTPPDLLFSSSPSRQPYPLRTRPLQLALMLAFSVLSPAVTALLGMVAISALPAPRGTPDVFSLDDLLAIVSKTAKGVQFDKNGRTQPFCSLEGRDTALTGNLTLPHGLHATEVVIASGIQVRPSFSALLYRHRTAEPDSLPPL